DIYQDAKPAGDSRPVDPEGVVALRAGVRAIEDLVPEGMGDPAWAGAPVAKYLAARDIQRRAQVPDVGDPGRYAVVTEPALKPGHVTYPRPPEADPHPAARLARNGPGRQPRRPGAAARRPGPATAGDQSRQRQRQGGHCSCRPGQAGQPALRPEPPAPAHDGIQRDIHVNPPVRRLHRGDHIRIIHDGVPSFWQAANSVRSAARARARCAVTVPGATPSTSAVCAVSRSRKIRSATTWRWRAGSRCNTAARSVSTRLEARPSAGAAGALRGRFPPRPRPGDPPRIRALRTPPARRRRTP